MTDRGTVLSSKDTVITLSLDNDVVSIAHSLPEDGYYTDEARKAVNTMLASDVFDALRKVGSASEVIEDNKWTLTLTHKEYSIVMHYAHRVDK